MQRLIAAAAACAAFSFSAFADAGASAYAVLASAHAAMPADAVSRLVHDYEQASRIIVAQANEAAAPGAVAVALAGAGEDPAECGAECCEAEKTAALTQAEQAAGEAVAALKAAAAEEEARKCAQIEAAIAAFESRQAAETVVLAAEEPLPAAAPVTAIETVAVAEPEAAVETEVEIIVVASETPAETAPMPEPAIVAPDQVAALVDAMAQQMKVAVMSAQRANEEAQQVVQARQEAQELLHLISELKNEAERMNAEIRDLREQLNSEKAKAQAAAFGQGGSQLDAALASLSIPTQTAGAVLGG